MYNQRGEELQALDELGFSYSTQAGCWYVEDGSVPYMNDEQALSLARMVLYRDEVKADEEEE